MLWSAFSALTQLVSNRKSTLPVETCTNHPHTSFRTETQRQLANSGSLGKWLQQSSVCGLTLDCYNGLCVVLLQSGSRPSRKNLLRQLEQVLIGWMPLVPPDNSSTAFHRPCSWLAFQATCTLYSAHHGSSLYLHNGSSLYLHTVQCTSWQFTLPAQWQFTLPAHCTVHTSVSA